MKNIQATNNDNKLLAQLHPLSYMLLNTIRQKGNMVKIPRVGIVVNDPKLIREIFMNKADFSKKGKGVSSGLWNPIIGEYGLLNMDGKEHLLMKRSVASVFLNANLEKVMLPEIELELNVLKTALGNNDEIDLVEVVTNFVARGLWKLIGFSDEDIKECLASGSIDEVRSVTHGISLTKKKMSDKQINDAVQKLHFIEVLTNKAFYSEKDNNEYKNIISTMKIDGYSLEEITSLVKSLMIAGTETVISFIPRMVAILIDSEKLKTLKENEILNAIDETLRVTVPTPVAARIAIKDCELGGKKIKAGTRMILNTLGACQNIGPFNSELPEVSKDIKNLWFGAGVHMCIGLPIAMLEASKVLEALLEVEKDFGEITIISRLSEKQGHTGCYKELILKAKE